MFVYNPVSSHYKTLLGSVDKLQMHFWTSLDVSIRHATNDALFVQIKFLCSFSNRFTVSFLSHLVTQKYPGDNSN